MIFGYRQTRIIHDISILHCQLSIGLRGRAPINSRTTKDFVQRIKPAPILYPAVTSDTRYVPLQHTAAALA